MDNSENIQKLTAKDCADFLFSVTGQVPMIRTKQITCIQGHALIIKELEEFEEVKKELAELKKAPAGKKTKK
jgi:hypothetical protein